MVERAGIGLLVEEAFALGGEAASISDARHLTSACLQIWDVCIDLDTVLLLVSEMATNALVHGDPPVSLTIGWDGSIVRVTVRDAQTKSWPVPGTGMLDEVGGLGVGLIASQADAWGFEITGDAKAVWFELHCSTEVVTDSGRPAGGCSGG